ncbi:phosphoenolpyruvate--protein phosphotransferase [Actinokineospora enzanensis]|uniref:phosphoenolpyruvate--protein phosphotransferase n=1 Tax=Actinokineospora enzanensis TaxID=155975 RepID=UPI00036C9AD3|nr:putative PEP-binding protein [Actinokineospora enzanensis]
MTAHSGLGVSPGVATGPVARLGTPPELPAEMPAPGTDDTDRALAALDATAAELERRAELVDGAAADVLTTSAVIARDPALAAEIEALVRQGIPAAWAVDRAIARYRDLLADGHLAERADDLADIRDRAVADLLDLPAPGLPTPGHPHVLVADDLSPADTALLDPGEVLAVITARGGPTGHTAILARAAGIPAVLSCSVAESLVDGQRVLVDGGTGQVIVSPTDADIASHQVGSVPDAAVTLPVTLLANIGGPDPAEGMDGVGLFRTEFFYLNRREAPTVEEQRAAYREVLVPLAGRRVVVRTLDVGSDKSPPYLLTRPEPNPALGLRGTRRTELLADQLTALAAAAEDTGVEPWVMAPMIATAAEAARFAETARAYGFAHVGVMVEIPAAALRAEDVLAEVDFVSIGTNDLAQYTFAADRESGELAELLDPWQPALLDLVARVVSAALAVAKPVGICGESAADPLLALVYTGLGVDSLSMTPNSAGPVREMLSRHDSASCREIATAVLPASTAKQARDTAIRLTAT